MGFRGVEVGPLGFCGTEVGATGVSVSELNPNASRSIEPIRDTTNLSKSIRSERSVVLAVRDTAKPSTKQVACKASLSLRPITVFARLLPWAHGAPIPPPEGGDRNHRCDARPS